MRLVLGHLIMQSLADIMMIVAIIMSLVAFRRTKQARRMYEKMARDNAPMMVSALEQAAAAICPLCGLALGEAQAVSERSGKAVTAEPQIDGQHIVHDGDVTATAPCRAVRVHADIRKILDTALAEQTETLKREMS